MTLSPMLDLFALTAALLACVTCAILGNFLVLRKLSLMGDAISHSVLPGLVVAFLITSSRSSVAMFVGAAAAGVATVLLVELVKRVGRVEPGAAMGVVFSVLFALGVLLLEQAAARQVDLDADCVLHGMLETIVWYDAPQTWAGVLSIDTLAAAPREVRTLALMLGVTLLVVTLLFKELRIASFDPALATTLGFSAGRINLVLMTLVAGATIASFEAVGSILVIAMLVCPAAAARHMTDSLTRQILWSTLFASLAAVLGYTGATWAPGLFGIESLNAAGSIACVSGVLLLGSMLLAPRHGWVATAIRRRSTSERIRTDDLLGAVYRARELGHPWSPDGRNDAAERALKLGLLTREGDTLKLTQLGLQRASAFIRTHRLWEHYLVNEAGLASDHVHEPAELLEHTGLTPNDDPTQDPHGREIPPDRTQNP